MSKQAFKNSLKEEIYKNAGFRKEKALSDIEESVRNLSIEEAIKKSMPPWLEDRGKSKLPLILAGTGVAAAGSIGYLNYLKNKQQQETTNSLKDEVYKQASFLSVLKSSPKGIKNAYLYNKTGAKLVKATDKINDITKANKSLSENVSKLTQSAEDLSKRNTELLKGNKAWKTVSAAGVGTGIAGVGYGVNEKRKSNNLIANSGYIY